MMGIGTQKIVREIGELKATVLEDDEGKVTFELETTDTSGRVQISGDIQEEGVNMLTGLIAQYQEQKGPKKIAKPKFSLHELVIEGEHLYLIKDTLLDAVKHISSGDVESNLKFGELTIAFWSTDYAYTVIVENVREYDLALKEVSTEMEPDVQEPPVKAFQVAKNYYVLAYTEREAIDFWYKMETPTTAEIEEAMRGGYGEVSPDRVIKTTWGREATIRDLINDFVELKITFPGSLRDYSHGRQ